MLHQRHQTFACMFPALHIATSKQVFLNAGTQVCQGGELYALLTSQPNKRFPEAQMQFYASEVPHLCQPDT